MVQHFQHSNPFMDLVRASLLIAINTIIFFSTKISYAQIIENSFEFEGKTRDYIIFLPQNFQPNMPVVFNLHGYTDNAQWQMDYTDMNSVADTTGFIVVYPNAIYPGFNTGLYMSGWPPLPNENDVGFISNLIDTIHINYGIDLSRVYVCGFSNGAIMTFKLACKLSHRFAAGASVGGVMLDSIVNNCYQSVTFPMLICNGTSDALIPYYGNHKQGKWSVNETVDFWVENNGCVLEADTVSLPNTDPTDGCTIDKFTFMNCEDSTEVVFYKVIGGGHSWPSGTKTGSWAGNTNRDINANVELWNFFKDYENPYADLDENPFADLAYAKSMEISHKYKNIPLQGDTLVVNAYLSNPKNHQVEVYAIIKADGGDYKDSIKLFDDGLHNDGNVSDNFYSGYKWLSNLEEDFYTVELFTNDIDMEKTKRFYFNEHFTTAGPIEIDTFSFQISRDSLLTVKNFKITNKSTVKTVKNVKVEIKTSDTTVSEIIKNSADFGDIAAGDSKTVSTAFNLYIDKNADPDSIKFEFEISSNGIVYWEIASSDMVNDTVTLVVENKSQYLPDKFVLS